MALFLDLDGTLIDFAPLPEGVVVDARLPALLRELDAALGGALALVSGRSLATIDALLQMPQLPAAGQHGAELRHADGSIVRAGIDTRGLDAARALVQDLAARAPAIHIEDKGSALAFHYRQDPGAEPVARELAATVMQWAGTEFELLRGNCVIELKSVRVDKGRALASLMMQPPFIGRRPWMLGDDTTDEPAFAMAQALGGIGVVIGPRRPSVALHGLAGVEAARDWLARLCAQHAGDGGAA